MSTVTLYSVVSETGNGNQLRLLNKKHLKNIGPIRYCEPQHAVILRCHSPGVATVARRLRIDVHDNDNATDGTAMAP